MPITRLGTYSQIKGTSFKLPCRVATTANITLSGTQTIDGVAVVAGERVLVKNQSTSANNGVYIVAAGAWSRAVDFSLDDDVFQGLEVYVSSGTANGGYTFVLTTANPITLGTTGLTFGGTYLPLAGGTLTGALTGTSATFSTWVLANDGTRQVYLNPAADFGNGALPTVQVTSNHALQFATNNTLRLTFHATTGAATFSSSIAATSATFSDRVTINLTGSDHNLKINSTGQYTTLELQNNGTTKAYPMYWDNTGNAAYIETVNSGAQIVFKSGASNTALTLASTGAATFSSTVSAQATTLTNNTGLLYFYNSTPTFVGGFGTVAWQVGGGSTNYTDLAFVANKNLNIYTNNSATAALSISTTGAATFTGNITNGSSANGLTFATNNHVITSNNLTDTRGIGFYANDGTQNPRAWIKHVTASGSQRLEFNSDWSTATAYASFAFLNGNVGIGTTSPATISTYKVLEITGPNTSTGGMIRTNISDNSIIGKFYTNSTGVWVSAETAHPLILETSNTERMRITSGGDVLMHQTSFNSSLNGQFFGTGGDTYLTRTSDTVLFINRKTNDGTLIDFQRDNASQGSISVSSGVVSYNSFLGSHWSQFSDGERHEVLKGTIVDAIDEMCEWENETNDRLPKSKISDTIESKNVYGVFLDWDNDWKTSNDFYVASVGLGFIRINANEVVKMGDYLQSNGDGTAKVQSDDILRSSTIAKVVSTNIITTYEDGSYLIAATLHCG